MTTPTPAADPLLTGEILIVEDSATQAMFLQTLLRRNRFTVSIARNGRLALEAISAKKPALVISDIQMPEMDGFTLCREITSRDDLRDIPVILLTALSAPQDIIHGLECGADNFMVKPYEEEILLARIRTTMANRALQNASGNEDRGVAVEFAGQRYVISSSRRQVLNLLLSTYETAVKTNRDLIQAHAELKAAQAQLIEAEKLQSVGRLAAGVAHEVRNPLAILEMGLGYLDASNLPVDQSVILKEMREAVHRANDVISGLMDLSPREIGMVEADIHEVIDRAITPLNEFLLRGRVLVSRRYAKDLPRLRIDAAKIEQVFMNLFTNALHAMPEGGVLILHTRTRPATAEEAAFDPGERGGARFREGDSIVEVVVEDSGTGIPAAQLGKVFEPFFSTKPTGTGIGLGLTVARKIIELHRGIISIRNRPEGGTQVTILLRIQ